MRRRRRRRRPTIPEGIDRLVWNVEHGRRLDREEVADHGPFALVLRNSRREGFERVVKLILRAFDLKLENQQLVDGGSCVMALGKGILTSRTSGGTIEMSVVEIFELQDGLVRRADVYCTDTKAVVEACAMASVGSSAPGDHQASA